VGAVEAFEIAECPDGLVEKKHGPSVLLCERPDRAFGTVGEDGVSTTAGNVLEKGEGGRRGVPFVVHDRKIAIESCTPHSYGFTVCVVVITSVRKSDLAGLGVEVNVNGLHLKNKALNTTSAIINERRFHLPG
jgi:hypothetical protein